MKARPILMHGRSITNLLAGRKSQTRRVVKPQPELIHKPGHPLDGRWGIEVGKHHLYMLDDELVTEACPYGQPGDLLYVRETWCLENDAAPEDGRPRKFGDGPACFYRATEPDVIDREDVHRSPWKPSIHMPRWASRLTLHLTDVRVERVQEIDSMDAHCEGVEGTERVRKRWDDGQPGVIQIDKRADFADLWDETNGRGAWDRNDWVWVLEFRVVQANVDDVIADPARYGIREAA